MAKFVFSPHLDGARYFQNSAKGLPDTTGGRNQRALLLRAAVVFSWLAVEETAKGRFQAYVESGFRGCRPHKLSELIMLCLALRKCVAKCLGRHMLLSSVGRNEDDERIREVLCDEALIAIALAGVRQEFDLQTFARFRAIRNDIVHCNSLTLEPSIPDVGALCAYAKQLVGTIEDAAVVHDGYGLGEVGASKAHRRP